MPFLPPHDPDGACETHFHCVKCGGEVQDHDATGHVCPSLTVEIGIIPPDARLSDGRLVSEAMDERLAHPRPGDYEWTFEDGVLRIFRPGER